MSGKVSEQARQLQEGWSLSHIFTRKVDDALKQARAEVLATCIEALKDGVPVGAGHGVGYIYNVLSNVQPAASDLEELLREERVRELRHFAENAPGYNTKVMRFIDARIAELEKARAIEEKS